MQRKQPLILTAEEISVLAACLGYRSVSGVKPDSLTVAYSHLKSVFEQTKEDLSHKGMLDLTIFGKIRVEQSTAKMIRRLCSYSSYGIVKEPSRVRYLLTDAQGTTQITYLGGSLYELTETCEQQNREQFLYHPETVEKQWQELLLPEDVASVRTFADQFHDRSGVDYLKKRLATPAHAKELFAALTGKTERISFYMVNCGMVRTTVFDYILSFSDKESLLMYQQNDGQLVIAAVSDERLMQWKNCPGGLL